MTFPDQKSRSLSDLLRSSILHIIHRSTFDLGPFSRTSFDPSPSWRPSGTQRLHKLAIKGNKGSFSMEQKCHCNEHARRKGFSFFMLSSSEKNFKALFTSLARAAGNFNFFPSFSSSLVKAGYTSPFSVITTHCKYRAQRLINIAW